MWAPQMEVTGILNKMKKGPKVGSGRDVGEDLGGVRGKYD